MKGIAPFERQSSLFELFASLDRSDYPAVMEEIERIGWYYSDKASQIGIRSWLEADPFAALDWCAAHDRQVYGPGLLDLDPRPILDWSISRFKAGNPAALLRTMLANTLHRDMDYATTALASLEPEGRARILEQVDLNDSTLKPELKLRWVASIQDMGLRNEVIRNFLKSRFALHEKTPEAFFQSYPDAFDRTSMDEIARRWSPSGLSSFSRDALNDRQHPWHQAIMTAEARAMIEDGKYDEACDLLTRFPDEIDQTLATNLARSALTGNPAVYLDGIMQLTESPARDLLVVEALTFWSSITGPDRPTRWLDSREATPALREAFAAREARERDAAR